jgi:hypothetical protein
VFEVTRLNVAEIVNLFSARFLAGSEGEVKHRKKHKAEDGGILQRSSFQKP